MWDSDTNTVIGQTGAAGTCTTTIYMPPHRCCISETHRRGNQHLTTAYGRCKCGKTYERKVWWNRRSEERWEAQR